MDIKILIDRTADFLSGRDIAQTELPTLRSVVLEHQQLYYETESPVIADVEFDRLYALLVALEDRYDDRTPDSPTARVGEGVSEKFTKHAHLSAMLSLDNSYDPEDLREFEKRIRNILKTEDSIEYALEPKFDGLGVSLRYEGGELVRGLTR
jgi:DNA ligase (NAD+)